MSVGAGDAATEADGRAALRRARVVVVGTVIGVLVSLVVGERLPRSAGVTPLVLPAALAGAVSPVVGYRLLHWRRARAVAEAAAAAAGQRAYVVATALAVSVTGTAALFGVVIGALSGRALPLIGALTHVLLAGAVWPTPERLEWFAGSTGDRG